MKNNQECFPILDQVVNDEPLIYFDNAATTQKPQQVIDAMIDYYLKDNANIHRGVHTLAQRATDAYEATRDIIKAFLNAKYREEILFNSGTTAGINFLAQSLVEPLLEPGDIILTSVIEHHSNLIPWQELAKRTGAKVEFIPLNDDFTIDLSALSSLKRVKCVAIHHVSNVLGVTQDIQAISEWVREQDAILIVDGAQAVAHQPIDLQKLNVDAYCFSGHKVYGPTGIGVCYLNKKHHNTCQPFFYGGEMIHQVSLRSANYKQAPWKFEGGTPPIAQVIGLKAAIEWLSQQDRAAIVKHEKHLVEQMCKGLANIPGVEVYGSGSGIVSFNLQGIHPHDAASGYDMEGIALRAGHHCAQPLMEYLNIQASLRASVAVYNTQKEVEQFIKVTKKIKEFFNGPI